MRAKGKIKAIDGDYSQFERGVDEDINEQDREREGPIPRRLRRKEEQGQLAYDREIERGEQLFTRSKDMALRANREKSRQRKSEQEFWEAKREGKWI